MYPSINAYSVPTTSNKTLAIVPPIPHTSLTSSYLTKSDLNNTHTYIKASNNKHHSETRAMNEHIPAMFAELTHTSIKTNKQEEKLTDISYKISTYEYHIEKLSINEMLQPFPLQVNN